MLSPKQGLKLERVSQNNRFQEIYTIEATRLKNWDYSKTGWYFVTICTDKWVCYFDNVVVKTITDRCWREIPKHFSSVRLGEYVVMPNHVHGVLEIFNVLTKPNANNNPHRRDVACNVSTTLTNRPEDQNDTTFYSAISPKLNSIPTIIRSFKSAVTKYCNENHIPFKWQPRFYDHVIHNEVSLTLIENYIRDNPENWEDDKHFKTLPAH